MYQPSLDSYTCVTCGLKFESSDLQKEHFKSDFHRFNLKRKTCGLPAVSNEAYEASRKPAAISTTNSSEEEKEEGGGKTRVALECAICAKRFRGAKAFEIHFTSRKHKIRARDLGVDPNPPSEMAIAVEEMLKHSRAFQETQKTEEEILSEIQSRPRLSSDECIFCGHHSKTEKDDAKQKQAENEEEENEEGFAKNLEHMAQIHSFFVPDLDCCVDLRGLIAYLAEKVAIWTRCIWCNDRKRAFYTVESVRQHMSDCGHCRMWYEDQSEYSQFYDYSKLAYPRSTSESEEGDGLEEEIGAKGSGVNISENGYELLLPSGKVIGHRSLQVAYQQPIHLTETRESILSEIKEQANRLRITASNHQSNALISLQHCGRFGSMPSSIVATYNEKTRTILKRQARMNVNVSVASNKLHVNRPQINV